MKRVCTSQCLSTPSNFTWQSKKNVSVYSRNFYVIKFVTYEIPSSLLPWKMLQFLLLQCYIYICSLITYSDGHTDGVPGEESIVSEGQSQNVYHWRQQEDMGEGWKYHCDDGWCISHSRFDLSFVTEMKPEFETFLNTQCCKNNLTETSAATVWLEKIGILLMRGSKIKKEWKMKEGHENNSLYFNC